MTDREKLAWAAGLFEGEGFFAAHRVNDRVCSLSAGINGFTDLDVLERFHKILGFGRITGPYHRLSKTTGKPQKPSYRWVVCSFEEIQRLVDLFSPWLGARRRNRADEVIGLFLSKESLKGKRRGTVKPFVIEIKQLLRDGMKNVDVAAKFDCSPGIISNIASGKRYGDIR